MSSVVAIYRDERFSPNSVKNDRAILDAVLSKLHRHDVVAISEQQLNEQHRAALYLSMGRLPRTIKLLKQFEHQNQAIVLNNAKALESFSRSHIHCVMQENGIAMPPEEGTRGYWVKRADFAAQTQDDVVYCKDKAEVDKTKEQFAQRGVHNLVVSAHVEGDLVKFYGVADSFFWHFYPTDTGHSKFGDEQHNGSAHHYPFNVQQLRHTVARLASLTGIEVYGGDCIINSDGRFFIIDFNDWPSFSPCCEQAAECIAHLANQLLATQTTRKITHE